MGERGVVIDTKEKQKTGGTSEHLGLELRERTVNRGRKGQKRRLQDRKTVTVTDKTVTDRSLGR